MKITKIWLVLRDGKPIMVDGGVHKGMLVFTAERHAAKYIQKRGKAGTGTVTIERLDIPHFIDIVNQMKPFFDQWGIEWMILDHPGETHPGIQHLLISTVLMEVKPSTRAIRLLSTPPSPAEDPPS